MRLFHKKVLSWNRSLGARVVVRERRGQFAVGVGLGEQVFSLLFDGLDGVGTGGPAQ